MNRHVAHRHLLILALVFAGCALAGHSLLKPEPLKWALTFEQPQITKLIMLEKMANYTNQQKLVVSLYPMKSKKTIPAHSFSVEVLCEATDILLKQQHFSDYPNGAGGDFIVQLPSELSSCFDEEATAHIKVNMMLNMQTIPEDFLVQGEIHIE